MLENNETISMELEADDTEIVLQYIIKHDILTLQQLRQIPYEELQKLVSQHYRDAIKEQVKVKPKKITLPSTGVDILRGYLDKTTKK